MAKDKELKPCPFCGSVDIEWFEIWEEEGGVSFVVECQECFISTADEPLKDVAKKVWNRMVENGGIK